MPDSILLLKDAAWSKLGFSTRLPDARRWSKKIFGTMQCVGRSPPVTILGREGHTQGSIPNKDNNVLNDQTWHFGGTCTLQKVKTHWRGRLLKI